MGSFGGNGLSRERSIQQLKWALQALVFFYVVVYAFIYKNTHLKLESVTGNAYVDEWPSVMSKDSATFALLDYCTTMFFEGSTYRCAFVNEIDLLQFKPGNFIPTRITVVRQRASCMDPYETNLSTCRLDYKTNENYQQQLDQYFIGAIETYQVQFTHAIHSDSLGQRTMSDVERFGVPECGSSERPGDGPMCFDGVNGGHDMATVGGLLAAANLTLNGNNDETNHPNRLEAFRTSGVKLSVHIRYNNIFPWWSWMGFGTVGYGYEVRHVPSQSVWRSITVRSQEEMRAWVSADKLADMGPYDRVLIWADGIDIAVHVTGTIGHVDLVASMLLLASALPLVYLVRGIVNCVAERSVRSTKYGQCEEDDFVRTENPAGVPFRGTAGHEARSPGDYSDPL